MKRLLLCIVCLIAMTAAGTGLKAQEVTVTLIPGWTWISCPSTEAVDFATALGDFTPQIGDIIKSQWGSATYKSNGQWRGNISQFSPGYGYHYYSNRTTPVMLTFNAQPQTLQVVVTTSEPMLVTGNSAMCGGNVVSNDGTYIIVKGICWATHETPTSNDSYLEEGSGEGSFTATMTGLNISTIYYVRAYAVTPSGTVYGEQQTFTTRDGIPEVSTDSVTRIFASAATCGGTVTDNGGLDVVARGVCWSSIHNPTINDGHSADGSGLGSFISDISGLTPNTTYYIRAYASTSYGTGYGEEMSFTTQSSYTGQYVDLGLPTGTLWALCNSGAEVPEEYGGYYGEYGIPNLGADWRLPTKEEWQELLNNTTSTWTIQNGVNGRLYTASNGNSLFLPAAGYIWSSSSGTLEEVGFRGYYWSSSLILGDDWCTYHKWYFCNGFNYDGEFNYLYGDIDYLVSIRAVHRKPCVINVTANPTEGGVVSGGGTYIDGTNCTVSATANEGYIFINWTENNEVVSTEATYSFTLDENKTLVANFTYVGGGGQAYVDLGLPSGTLWATCNVGADSPSDYGDYFAWGETQPKDTYNWSTYQYCMGSYNTLTKYCYNSEYGYNGFTDNLTVLLPEDDAATVNWGTDWRIPTNEEWQELYQNTTYTWTTLNGITGILFTASNGNSLFLPLAGIRGESSLNYLGSVGQYLSSFLGTYRPYGAWLFYFDNVDKVYGYGMWDPNRHHGNSVRAVRSGSQSNTPTGAINGKFTINADGDQVYFSQGNLQYQASTNTWKFAENQWDYVGDDTYGTVYENEVKSNNSLISSTYDGWIDLFAWGTSGYNHGAICYQPWSTSQTVSDYYAYGSYTYNLYDQTGQADWGYNPISNGGNQTNQWRTLTQSEWNYLFNTRSTTSGIRYAKANVDNVNGVILLPDDWSTSTYSLSNTNSSGASFSSNTMTASQWSTLEQAGAVFLPGAGYRLGTSVYNVDSGYFWSASYNGSNLAYLVYFGDSSLSTNGGSYSRYVGQGVRLVRVAEN